MFAAIFGVDGLVVLVVWIVVIAGVVGIIRLGSRVGRRRR
jgi:hypothetical protein